MTVTDGDLDGSGIDRIRMKIYNRNSGYVYYDNQHGDSEAELPETIVGLNSEIVIRASNQNNPSVTRNVSQPENEDLSPLDGKLASDIYPNPANQYFSMIVKSNQSKEQIQVQVIDQQGRVVETISNCVPGSLMRIGHSYARGVYFVRITQGSEMVTHKIIKLDR